LPSRRPLRRGCPNDCRSPRRSSRRPRILDVGRSSCHRQRVADGMPRHITHPAECALTLTAGRRILVVGAGHVASRVRERVAAAGGEVYSLPGALASSADAGQSSAAALARVLAPGEAGEPGQSGRLSAACLVDDADEVNLELLLALRAVTTSLPVTVALFNGSVAAHLGATHPDVRVVNPAAVAAPAFVAALETPVARTTRAAPLFSPRAIRPGSSSNRAQSLCTLPPRSGALRSPSPTGILAAMRGRRRSTTPDRDWRADGAAGTRRRPARRAWPARRLRWRLDEATSFQVDEQRVAMTGDHEGRQRWGID